MRAVARLLVVVAALALGVVLGWTTLSELQARHESAQPEVEVVEPQLGSGDDVQMPDVRGLAVDVAMEIIADAGIPAGVVARSDRVAAGAAGVVIEQAPTFGTPAPAEVSLVVSTVAVVPEVSGRSGSEVSEELSILGAQVEIVQEYRAGASAGDALDIAPAPGEPLPRQVTLRVAEPPASVFLSTLDSINGGCSAAEASVNGVSYEHAMTCSASDEPVDVSWVVGRAVDTVTGVVGIPDDTDDTSARVRVDVLADGRQVASATAAYGEPHPLEAVVTGALRMTVRTTLLSAVESRSFSSGQAILGDVRVTGGAGPIGSLSEEP